MPTTRLRDGEVTLYTRGDSKNYYAGFRMRGGGRLQESLKTRNKAEAKERALERHDDLKARQKYGLTQKTVTFAEAAEAWLLDLERQVAGGGKKKRNLVDYAPTIERYLKPYFAGKNVDSITTPDMSKYGIWRRDYWLSGPGAFIKELKYVRGGVEITRPISS